MACISSLQSIRWAKYQSHLFDLRQEKKKGGVGGQGGKQKEENKKRITRNSPVSTVISRTGWKRKTKLMVCSYKDIKKAKISEASKILYLKKENVLMLLYINVKSVLYHKRGLRDM